jgi:hypothetical protein
MVCGYRRVTPSTRKKWFAASRSKSYSDLNELTVDTQSVYSVSTLFSLARLVSGIGWDPVEVGELVLSWVERLRAPSWPPVCTAPNVLKAGRPRIDVVPNPSVSLSFIHVTKYIICQLVQSLSTSLALNDTDSLESFEGCCTWWATSVVSDSWTHQKKWLSFTVPLCVWAGHALNYMRWTKLQYVCKKKGVTAITQVWAR